MSVSAKKNGEKKWKSYDHVMRAPTSMDFSGSCKDRIESFESLCITLIKNS
jgi:hypothetical protein